MAETVAPVSNDEVTADEMAGVVMVRGKRAELSPMQATIFCTLLNANGRVVTHREIVRAMYPGKENIEIDRDVSNRLRVHMSQIRGKLAECSLKPASIAAVRNSMAYDGGYSFKPIFTEADEDAQKELASEPQA